MARGQSSLESLATHNKTMFLLMLTYSLLYRLFGWIFGASVEGREEITQSPSPPQPLWATSLKGLGEGPPPPGPRPQGAPPSGSPEGLWGGGVVG